MRASIDSVGTLPRLPFTRPSPLEPAAELARLRAEEPVARVRSAGGEPTWLVTRYDDARAVLSDRRFRLALPGAVSGDQGTNYSLFQDPPEHTRLRRPVTGAFTHRRVAGLRDRATEVTAALVADMATRERPVDLMEALAFPLPITVLSELLGVPATERERFRACADALMSVHEEGVPTDPGEGWGNMSQQISDLIARKRQEPGDDLLSALIAVRDADRLSLAELVTMAVVLIVAGYVSTAMMTGTGVIMLTGHDQLARLAADPALVPTAVEEVLRFQTVTGDTARLATEDLELAGVRIRAGDKVVISIASVNRDERRFTDPDRFDISRSDNPHMTFSHGIHHCLGAHLARMELQVVFSTLATRLPGLHLAIGADKLAWQRSEFFGDELPLAVPVSW